MKTYEEIRGHKQDFDVSYRLYCKEEGGQEKVFQHIRCDFAYAEDDIEETGIYMIHPEFMDVSGNPIEENTQLPVEGFASMWILVPEMREKVHKEKLHIGTKGYFMSGSRKLGEVTVTKIVGLHENV